MTVQFGVHVPAASPSRPFMRRCDLLGPTPAE
jgi:hypothetical protein